MKQYFLFLLMIIFTSVNLVAEKSLSYPIVDTLQNQCFNNKQIITCSGDKNFLGQDAQYQGFQPSYTKNKNGSILDNVTKLIWASTIDTNNDGKITAADKMTYNEALKYAKEATLHGFDDWRVPTIKELYSLILFDGEDPSAETLGNPDKIKQKKVSLISFIDTRIFPFASGDTASGERVIDSQYISSTKYVSTTMNKQETIFGVNFIDGRIKGYGIESRRGEKTFYVLLVRGNSDYGKNDFIDNKDGTILDKATGLTWQKQDNQKAIKWQEALNYCETLNFADKDNWRVPNVKELQSIVDYSLSPDTSNSAAINPIFEVSTIKGEDGGKDYPNYWSNTTHKNSHKNYEGRAGAYVAFGKSFGYMRGKWIDVHGAGAQRSDPKQGDPKNFLEGHGPQGDAIRINNYVRCVSSDISFQTTPKVEVREAFSFTIGN